MKKYIRCNTLTEAEMQAEMDAHFAELDKKIEAFMRSRSGKFTDPEVPYCYIEHNSLDNMIRDYIRWYNLSVKENGDGFVDDWDDDATLSILYRDGTIKSYNSGIDDGSKRIKVDGIDSIIYDSGWGTAYAGPHVQIVNYREWLDYGKWGYQSVEQRYNDYDDIRVEFTV